MGFDEFCAEYSADLVNFATLVTGHEDTGQDLAQDVMYDVCRRWGRLRIEDPEAYLHTMAIRRHHRQLQRLTHRDLLLTHAPPGQAAMPSAEDAVISRVVLIQALAQLPARQREAVVLSHVYDYSSIDVARVLGCSPAAARSLTTRGLAGLRGALTKTDLTMRSQR